MNDNPVDLDKHRGMKSQKATDIRRVLAEAEANAKVLRDRQAVLESQLLSAPAASCQNRRVASSRRRVGLVQHQGQRHVCLGPACHRGGLPRENRGNQSAAGKAQGVAIGTYSASYAGLTRVSIKSSHQVSSEEDGLPGQARQ